MKVKGNIVPPSKRVKWGFAPDIGAIMPDGTIYAGISPDTGDSLYVMPVDAPLPMAWKGATKYAAALDAHGHKSWRLPTRAELKVLFENRHEGALKGTFKEQNGSVNARWYWSCTERPDNSSFVYIVRFTDGDGVWIHKDFFELSTRPVRAEPRPPR